MLDTLSVKVVRQDGTPGLDQRRTLRIVKLPGALVDGMFCVARHNKAIIVTKIVDHETVAVDMKAERIPLKDTRIALPSDLSGGTMVGATA